MGIVAEDERRDLRDEPFAPQVTPPLREADDLFAVIRERDILLQHPYDSLTPSSSWFLGQRTTPMSLRSSRRSTAPGATPQS